MAVTAMKVKSSVESLREVVQDLLVPELKSLKVSFESLRSEMNISFDAVRTEMNISFDAVRTEMNISFDAVRTEMRLRDEKQAERFASTDRSIQQLSDKLDVALDVRVRLASLEARLPRA